MGVSMGASKRSTFFSIVSITLPGLQSTSFLLILSALLSHFTYPCQYALSDACRALRQAISIIIPYSSSIASFSPLLPLQAPYSLQTIRSDYHKRYYATKAKSNTYEASLYLGLNGRLQP